MESECWLYALEQRGECDRPIKFGIATDVEQRIRCLQTGSAVKLVRLAIVPGGRSLERAIHNILAPWRMSGEWFNGNCSGIKRFAKHLTNPDYRDALLRWDSFPGEFKRFTRRIIRLEDDAEWLAYIAEPLGSIFPRLIVYIDRCASLPLVSRVVNDQRMVEGGAK